MPSVCKRLGISRTLGRSKSLFCRTLLSDDCQEILVELQAALLSVAESCVGKLGSPLACFLCRLLCGVCCSLGRFGVRLSGVRDGANFCSQGLSVAAGKAYSITKRQRVCCDSFRKAFDFTEPLEHSSRNAIEPAKLFSQSLHGRTRLVDCFLGEILRGERRHLQCVFSLLAKVGCFFGGRSDGCTVRGGCFRWAVYCCGNLRAGSIRSQRPLKGLASQEAKNGH